MYKIISDLKSDNLRAHRLPTGGWSYTPACHFNEVHSIHTTIHGVGLSRNVRVGECTKLLGDIVAVVNAL